MVAVPVERESLLELRVAQLADALVTRRGSTYFERRVHRLSITREGRDVGVCEES